MGCCKGKKGQSLLKGIENSEDQIGNPLECPAEIAEEAPVLVSVTVAANATHTAGKAWDATYQAASDVQVVAVTAPNNNAAEWAQIVWTNGNAGAQPNQRLLPRDALGTVTVTGALGGIDDHVDITVQPILVSVTVAANATHTAGKAWDATYQAASDVQVVAVTAPNNDAAEWAQIVWTNGNAGAQPNQRLLPRDALGAVTVTGALGGIDDHVDITVRPILVSVTVAADAANAVNTAGKVWKALRDAGVGAAPVLVQATTAPNDDAAEWAQIVWTNGAVVAAQDNQHAVARGAVIDPAIRVTATLGGVADHVDVRICQPPVLTIDAITFAGHRVVERDTLGNIAAPEWLAVGPTIDPVAYNRNTNVQLTPTFNVTTAPTDAEQVVVSGTCTFGATVLTWTGNLTVNPADLTVAPGAALVSDVALPNVVDCYDPATIAWTATPTHGATTPAGNSAHLIYATLGAATGGVTDHWTLLDVSCRAAAGRNAANAVVTAIFGGPFAGFNVVRKRDATQLTYWVPNTTTATNTSQLLARPDGGGQCGSWAELFRDMCRVHGIGTVNKVCVQVITAPLYAGGGYQYGFLVKNWQFNAPPAAAAAGYSHAMFDATAGGCQSRPPNGVQGQANPNPPPAFFNHFVVIDTATNTIYDPSYGATTANRLAWEAASIDGLFDQVAMTAGFATGAGATNIVEFVDLTTNLRIP